MDQQSEKHKSMEIIKHKDVIVRLANLIVATSNLRHSISKKIEKEEERNPDIILEWITNQPIDRNGLIENDVENKATLIHMIEKAFNNYSTTTKDSYECNDDNKKCKKQLIEAYKKEIDFFKQKKNYAFLETEDQNALCELEQVFINFEKAKYLDREMLHWMNGCLHNMLQRAGYMLDKLEKANDAIAINTSKKK